MPAWTWRTNGLRELPHYMLSAPTASLTCSSGAQTKRLHRLTIHLLWKLLLSTLLRSSQKVLGGLARLSRLPRWSLRRRKKQSKPGQAGCTPSYYNAEASLDSMSREEQMLAAPAGPWPAGLNNFMDVLEDWRSRDGELEGLHVSGVQVD